MTGKQEHWTEIVKKADAYKSIGQEEVYLYGQDNDDYPWEFVVSVESGGSHRFDINTDVWFRAEHPSGLKLRWSFDIEPSNANGKGHYEIDTDGCKQVLKLLPLDARQAFQDYLTNCSQKVHEKAEEQWQWVQRQFQDAETLRVLGDARWDV